MTSQFTNVRLKTGLVDHRPMVTLSYNVLISYTISICVSSTILIFLQKKGKLFTIGGPLT